jgi:tripartite motif-containing protein 71
MKRFILFLAALFMVSTVLAGFKYEGEWRSNYSNLSDVDVAPNGNVYTTDYVDEVDTKDYVEYFTPTGSLLGSWWCSDHARRGLAVAPNGDVYTGGCTGSWIYHHTATGSLLDSWRASGDVYGGDIAPNRNVYVAIGGHYWPPQITYFTPSGSFLGSWVIGTFPYEQPGTLTVAPSGNVYVVLPGNNRVAYFTSSGSQLGSWGADNATCIAASPGGDIFLASERDNRVSHYGATGSFLGSWGAPGSGPGFFNGPLGIAVSPNGRRIYVADSGNKRVQYFCSDIAIKPTSLGRVKAIFK